MRKMKVEVRDFRIDIRAELSQEHPKTYTDVSLEYHFYGSDLDQKKLERAVQLSVEKYCGVIEMFRSFARLEWATFFHEE
jgi:putative redox protein